MCDDDDCLGHYWPWYALAAVMACLPDVDYPYWRRDDLSTWCVGVTR